METLVDWIREFASGEIMYMSLTVVVYILVVTLNRRYRKLSILLHPVLFSAVVIIGVLKSLQIEYAEYMKGNSMLNFMLGFSVVTVGYIMHKNFNRIKCYKYTIIITTLLGSIVGVMSVIILSKLLHLDDVVMNSMQSKSVTTAIALSLSESIGGIAPLTILGVVVAGVFGSAIGPYIFKIIKVSDPVAKGLALGAASHAVGTAKAIEIGALEGAVGGVAIGLMGLFTSIIIPIAERYL